MLMTIVDIAMTNLSVSQLAEYLNFNDHTDIKFLDYPPILSKQTTPLDDEYFSRVCKQMGDIVKKSGVKIITLDSFSEYRANSDNNLTVEEIKGR